MKEYRKGKNDESLVYLAYLTGMVEALNEAIRGEG